MAKYRFSTRPSSSLVRVLQMLNSEKLIFYCTDKTGYSSAVMAEKNHVIAKKKSQEVYVEFSKCSVEIETLEGRVIASSGDAIVTGKNEERWPILRKNFIIKYDPVTPTQFGQDGVYSSKPISVLALQMSASFCVILIDGISKLKGLKDDWLVDYGDGSLGVVASKIFMEYYEIIAE